MTYELGSTRNAVRHTRGSYTALALVVDIDTMLVTVVLISGAPTDSDFAKEQTAITQNFAELDSNNSAIVPEVEHSMEPRLPGCQLPQTVDLGATLDPPERRPLQQYQISECFRRY